MGYYTHFTLTVDNYSTESDIFKAVEDESGYSEMSFNGNGESCKWYSHETDLIKVSKIFPNDLITLNGEGEENDDLWIKYFKNGNMQVCRAIITYDQCNLI